jgi:hypothetical protein
VAASQQILVAATDDGDGGDGDADLVSHLHRLRGQIL